MRRRFLTIVLMLAATAVLVAGEASIVAASASDGAASAIAGATAQETTRSAAAIPWPLAAALLLAAGLTVQASRMRPRALRVRVRPPIDRG